MRREEIEKVETILDLQTTSLRNVIYLKLLLDNRQLLVTLLVKLLETKPVADEQTCLNKNEQN